MALIYIFKPGQEDEIFNPSTGPAGEEDMAIAMSRFSYVIFVISCYCWQPQSRNLNLWENDNFLFIFGERYNSHFCVSKDFTFQNRSKKDTWKRFEKEVDSVSFCGGDRLSPSQYQQVSIQQDIQPADCFSLNLNFGWTEEFCESRKECQQTVSSGQCLEWRVPINKILWKVQKQSYYKVEQWAGN